jgi:DNA (cytosine-5)-methyltransferase 1
MVWENVPGAFSSNKGEDFRAVLEETAKIADETVVIPGPPKGKWPTAGCIMGDGWSIAWRILDAQYWGVPQRRRRIFLVADFGGQSAPEVLFKREGLRRHLAESGEAREGIATNAERGFDAASWDCRGKGSGAVAGTLKSGQDRVTDYTTIVAYGICSDASNSMKSSNPHSGIYEANTSRTLDMNGGSPACNQGGIAIVQAAGFCPEQSAKARGIGYEEEISPTLRKDVTPAVCAGFNGFKSVSSSIQYQEDRAATLEAGMPGNVINCQPSGIAGTVSSKWAKGTGGPAGDEHYNLVCRPLRAQAQHSYREDSDNVILQQYSVRRLTPLECERLQDYEDGWTDIPGASDSGRYKACGNSVAVCCPEYVLEGIKEILQEVNI